ncbi:hypothetical protein Tco_1362501 [Tanacetum coccineum]
MSGNIAHLSEFKDFDGGYVTFGEDNMDEESLSKWNYVPGVAGSFSLRLAQYKINMVPHDDEVFRLATPEGLDGTQCPTTEDTPEEGSRHGFRNLLPSYLLFKNKMMTTSYAEQGFLVPFMKENLPDLQTSVLTVSLSQEEPKESCKALRDPAWVEACRGYSYSSSYQNSEFDGKLTFFLGCTVQTAEERKSLSDKDNMSMKFLKKVQEWYRDVLSASRLDISSVCACARSFDLRFSSGVVAYTDRLTMLELHFEIHLIGSQPLAFLVGGKDVNFLGNGQKQSAEILTDDNGNVKIHATIDGHSLSITEGSLRRHLIGDQMALPSLLPQRSLAHWRLFWHATDSR